MTWTLEQRQTQSDGLMNLLVIGVALVATFFGVGSAIFVSYDSYLIVVRQVLFLLIPWVGVGAAFRGAYKIVAACFALTAALAYWISETVWGIPIVGILLVGATLMHDRSRETS